MARKEIKKIRSSSQNKSNKIRPEKIIVSIFMGVTVLMLFISIIAAANTCWVLFNEKSVEGRVVDLVVRYDDQGNNFYYPVVNFVMLNGSRNTVQMSEGSWPAAYTIDEKITVIYNPEKPNEAHIQTNSSTIAQWILPLITGTLGIAFLLATLLVRWILKQDTNVEKAREETDQL
jgi:hypothetical protein